MASSSTLPGDPFIAFTGPVFLGQLFNCGFFGILTAQLYTYYKSGYRDSPWIRGLVVVIYLLDVLQTILTMHLTWNIIVLHWGDGSIFASPPWSNLSLPVISGLVSALVQVFFAWRIWILRGSVITRLAVIVIILVAMMQCVSAIVYDRRLATIPTLEMITLLPNILVWFIGQVTCDILIAITMVYILYSSKIPYFEVTNNMLDRLMIQAIRSGSITAVAALVELILFVIQPSNYIHVTFLFFMSKLYSNVLMSNLNGRRKSDTSYSLTLSSSLFSGRSSGNQGPIFKPADPCTDIHIQTFRTVELSPESKAEIATSSFSN